MNRYDDSTEDWSIEGMEAELSGEKAGMASVAAKADASDRQRLNPLSHCLNCGVTHEFARGLCIVDYIEGYPVYGDHVFAPLETIEYPGARSLIRAHLWHEHNELVRSFGSPFVPLSRTEWTTTFFTQPPEKFVAEVCPVRGLFVEAA